MMSWTVGSLASMGIVESPSKPQQDVYRVHQILLGHSGPMAAHMLFIPPRDLFVSVVSPVGSTRGLTCGLA
jgi:hypothetical protein